MAKKVDAAQKEPAQRIAVVMKQSVSGPRINVAVGETASFKMISAGRLIRLGYATAVNEDEGKAAVAASEADERPLGLHGEAYTEETDTSDID